MQCEASMTNCIIVAISVDLFAGGDFDGQAILLRRKRTGGVRREHARRIYGDVEIENHGSGLRKSTGGRRGVEESRGVVGGLPGSQVAHHNEEFIFFDHRIETQLAASGGKSE